MNHGWPNLGHDSIVHAVQDAACDLAPVLEPDGLRIRAVSFEVRQHHMIPEAPGGRFAIYVGTGGPGHIDPHQNDGRAEGAQGHPRGPGLGAAGSSRCSTGSATPPTPRCSRSATASA